MKLLGSQTETRHRHEVRFDVEGAQPMMTREKVSFSPSRITIIYERIEKRPVALTTVLIQGPVLDGRSLPPIMLKYCVGMSGTDPRTWATSKTWQTRYRSLPIWVQRLVEAAWPGSEVI